MKKMLKLLGIIASLAMILGFGLTACSSGSDDDDDEFPSKVKTILVAELVNAGIPEAELDTITVDKITAEPAGVVGLEIVKEGESAGLKLTSKKAGTTVLTYKTGGTDIIFTVTVGKDGEITWVPSKKASFDEAKSLISFWTFNAEQINIDKIMESATFQTDPAPNAGKAGKVETTKDGVTTYEILKIITMADYEIPAKTLMKPEGAEDSALKFVISDGSAAGVDVNKNDGTTADKPDYRINKIAPYNSSEKLQALAEKEGFLKEDGKADKAALGGSIEVMDPRQAYVANVKGPFKVTMYYGSNSSSEKTDRYQIVKIGADYASAEEHAKESEKNSTKVPLDPTGYSYIYSGTDTVSLYFGTNKAIGRIYGVKIDQNEGYADAPPEPEPEPEPDPSVTLKNLVIKTNATVSDFGNSADGATFSAEGLAVQAERSDGSKVDLVLGTDYEVDSSAVDMATKGTYTVKIKGLGKYAELAELSYTVTVSAPGEAALTETDIEISGDYKTAYMVGAKFEKDKLVVKVVKSDGSRTVLESGYTVTPETIAADTQKVVVAYKTFSKEIPITIKQSYVYTWDFSASSNNEFKTVMTQQGRTGTTLATGTGAGKGALLWNVGIPAAASNDDNTLVAEMSKEKLLGLAINSVAQDSAVPNYSFATKNDDSALLKGWAVKIAGVKGNATVVINYSNNNSSDNNRKLAVSDGTTVVEETYATKSANKANMTFNAIDCGEEGKTLYIGCDNELYVHKITITTDAISGTTTADAAKLANAKAFYDYEKAEADKISEANVWTGWDALNTAKSATPTETDAADLTAKATAIKAALAGIVAYVTPTSISIKVGEAVKATSGTSAESLTLNVNTDFKDGALIATNALSYAMNEGATANVAWSATGVTIDAATGVISGVTGAVASASITVTATGKNSTTVSATLPLVIEEKEEKLAAGDTVTVDGPASVGKGTSVKVTATMEKAYTEALTVQFKNGETDLGEAQTIAVGSKTAELTFTAPAEAGSMSITAVVTSESNTTGVTSAVKTITVLAVTKYTLTMTTKTDSANDFAVINDVFYGKKMKTESWKPTAYEEGCGMSDTDKKTYSWTQSGGATKMDSGAVTNAFKIETTGPATVTWWVPESRTKMELFLA